MSQYAHQPRKKRTTTLQPGTRTNRSWPNSTLHQTPSDSLSRSRWIGGSSTATTIVSYS